jgi:hypothetical protein
MPSWKAKKLRKLSQEKVLLELCRRLANSIGPIVVERLLLDIGYRYHTKISEIVLGKLCFFHIKSYLKDV